MSDRRRQGGETAPGAKCRVRMRAEGERSTPARILDRSVRTTGRTPLSCTCSCPIRRSGAGKECSSIPAPPWWQKSSRSSGRAVYSSSMLDELDFEKPLTEIETRLAQLRAAEDPRGSRDEIARLEDRLGRLQQKIYGGLTAWQRAQIARHPKRPHTLDFVGLLIEDWVELHGDRVYGDDKAIVGGLARFDGAPVVAIGHQKGRDTRENIARNFGMPHPEGYRKALRLMQLAEKFGAPIVTFIDTPAPIRASRGKSAARPRPSRATPRDAGLATPIVTS